jgi:hypothetical protein
MGVFIEDEFERPGVENQEKANVFYFYYLSTLTELGCY